MISRNSHSVEVTTFPVPGFRNWRALPPKDWRRHGHKPLMRNRTANDRGARTGLATTVVSGNTFPCGTGVENGKPAQVQRLTGVPPLTVQARSKAEFASELLHAAWNWSQLELHRENHASWRISGDRKLESAVSAKPIRVILRPLFRQRRKACAAGISNDGIQMPPPSRSARIRFAEPLPKNETRCLPVHPRFSGWRNNTLGNACLCLTSNRPHFRQRGVSSAGIPQALPPCCCAGDLFEGGSVAIKPSQTETVAGFRLAVTRPAFSL